VATATKRARPRREGQRPQAAPALDRLVTLQPDAALDELSSSREGLAGLEAAARLEQVGPNERAAAGRTLLSVLLGQLRSPLLGLLLAAAAVSIGVGERTDGGISSRSSR
jgi:Mg2+-importing ATPase